MLLLASLLLASLSTPRCTLTSRASIAMRLDGSGQPFDEEQRRSELFDLYHVPDSVVVSDGVAAAVDAAPAKRIDAAPAKRLIDLFPEASDSAEDSERLLGRVLGGLKRRLSRRKDAETLLRLEALLEACSSI